MDLCRVELKQAVLGVFRLRMLHGLKVASELVDC